MLQHMPNPSMGHTWKGCCKIEGSDYGNVTGIEVHTQRVKDHGVNPGSRIYIHDVVQEIPTSSKPILRFVGNPFILGFEALDVGRHNDFIVGIF